LIAVVVLIDVVAWVVEAILLVDDDVEVVVNEVLVNITVDSVERIVDE
jgi:hypothetical protein